MFQGLDAADGEDTGSTSAIAGLANATAQGRTKHFGRLDRCMHLRIMATRPHYQQQGFAKALCEWGVDAAASRGMAITVLTGPRGYILFSDLGFTDVGPFPVRVGGGREGLIVKAMVLAPVRKERRGSFLGSMFGRRVQ
ncbi:GNAT family N-acetyltransferase [Candidatus Bathyarchaeota archaeon]|nr:GNAT family N-acetyltransferase [Candidatus Bathyarchaeota archaeon]